VVNQLLVPLVNEPTGSIELGGGELAQTAGTTTISAGIADLGDRSTWLVQGGSFTNVGTLATAVTHTVTKIVNETSLGQISVTAGGRFTAGGTLAPSVEWWARVGSHPVTGSKFSVVTANGGSLVGHFAAVTGNFTADDSNETLKSPSLGVIYGVGPTIKKLTGGVQKFTIALTCGKGAESCLRYTVTATVGKRTVASSSGTVKAGKSLTRTLKLNGSGLALLKRSAKVKVKVVIKAGGRTLKSATVTVSGGTRTKR
jgi:hypothetical protein